MRPLLPLCAAFVLLGTSLAAEAQSQPPAAAQPQHPAPKGNVAETAATFSDAVAAALLSRLTDGLQGRSRRQTLSAFDPAKLPGYGRFAERITALLEHAEYIRVYYRLVQTAVEGERGIALVNLEMEVTPRASASPRVRKRDQLRIVIGRSKNGWRIVDFSPREFFFQ